MRKTLSIAAAVILAVAVAPAPAGAQGPPLWAQHVQNYPGGISDGVRAKLMADRLAGSATAAPANATAPNVQMSDETSQDRPTDETAVALNPSNPQIGIASANDFNVPNGLWIGRTTDGGHTWTSLHKGATDSKGQHCVGSDPSVVYSVRDQAFYLSTLCFFFVNPTSEVQVWKSVDNGQTWTPSNQASTVISNITSTGVDDSVFYDKELLAVDNNAGGPHYGRLYITFIKFHMLPSAFSDFCPVQLAFTDSVPTDNPATAVWQHTPVVPDRPQDNGVGPGANQFATPVVDSAGGLDIAYMTEECNTALDHGHFFKRSTDGGVTLSATIEINHPGEYADNPDLGDLLPNKAFRAPDAPSIAFNAATGRLEYVYQNDINLATSGADISFQQSSDFGKHWSHAKFISITASGAPAPNDQYEASIAADESGHLHAIWYDNRNDPGNKLIETFQALSTDDGATWTNRDISTAPWNPDLSFFKSGSFIGDYTWIAASDSACYPTWTDGRNTSGPPNGETDVFTSIEAGCS
jgi:photosystem II stability/assembly factor-like uncharacterized protein